MSTSTRICQGHRMTPAQFQKLDKAEANMWAGLAKDKTGIPDY